MKYNYININSYSTYKIKERKVCCSYFDNEYKKCKLYYNKILLSNEIHTVCPYGYSTLKFGNVILTSLITSKCNIDKIRRSLKYKKIKDDLESIDETWVTQNIKIFNEILIRNSLYKPLIHDLGNALNYLLTIKPCIDNENSQLQLTATYYNHLSVSLAELRNYSGIEKKFSLLEDYSSILQKYDHDYKNLYNYAKEYSEIAENIKDYYLEEYERDDTTRSYLEGFSLVKTLIEYNSKRYDPSNVDTFNVSLKPHKMLKKLSRLLAYRAETDNINIVFAKQNDIDVYNSPDIYIALFTLLDNAIKYSKPDSVISIELDSDLSCSTIKIKNIFDNMSDDLDTSKLGQKGYTANKKKSGSGLGLFLVKSIIERTKCSINYDIQKKEWVTLIKIPSL